MTITLRNLQDWHGFVADNRDAIIEQYGTPQAALHQARHGGLSFGGGAAPAFVVTLEDAP